MERILKASSCMKSVVGSGLGFLGSILQPVVQFLLFLTHTCHVRLRKSWCVIFKLNSWKAELVNLFAFVINPYMRDPPAHKFYEKDEKFRRRKASPSRASISWSFSNEHLQACQHFTFTPYACPELIALNNPVELWTSDRLLWRDAPVFHKAFPR